MEITSPNNLWKDYDVDALPLNMTSLSERTENGVLIKPYYFDGYTTVDGRVRTFIKIIEHEDAKGVVLYLNNVDSAENDDIITALYEHGYTVAALDYLGKTDTKVNFTIYPKSLQNCNGYGHTQFEIADDEKYSCWYIWTCIARRAIKLLKEKYDNKIYAVGNGMGGSTVYKLAVFDDGLTGCATLGNIIPDVVGNGNQIINYHASLDTNAYSTLCRVPLFMAVASNAEDGSFDDMSELAAATESLKYFRIAERAFSDGTKIALSDLFLFMENCTQPTENDAIPHISASNSEGSLYLEIERPNYDADSESDNKTVLFVSFCIEDPRYRNWMNIPLIGLGGGKFIARINVCNATKPICAFVNFIQNDGNKSSVKSSALLKVIPKSLNIVARSGVAHRKIYDGSMGIDGWTSRRCGKISVVKGPFGIEGVTSETNSILTFKPGDDLFKVPADTLLQLMVCGEPQTISVNVYDKNNMYTCPITINNREDWHKFSLAHTSFKCVNSPPFDWSQILMLELISDKPFIIGSVLWI